MAQAAAGWYDQGDGRQRYWDGAAWTEHFAPMAPPPAAAAPPASAPPEFAAPPASAPPALAEPPAPSSPAMAATPTPGPAAALPGAVALPTKKRKVWPWVLGIGGLLLLLVAGAIVLFVVVLNKASEGPRDAVHAFDEAWRTGDCAALEETTTEWYRESTGWTECAEFQASGPSSTDGLSLKVIGFEVSGDAATVTTKETYSDDEATYTGTYELIKIDGQWKIDSVILDE